MTNSEDYLDSLLKAASENDDPNSAINKVREMTAKETEAIPDGNDYADSEGLDDLLKSLENIEETPESETSDDVSQLLDVENLVGELDAQTDITSDVEDAPIIDGGDIPLDAEGELDSSLDDDLASLLSSLDGVEETPIEETPVEEAPVEEAPVEEVPVEEAPVEETPVEDLLIDELPAEETPVEEVPVEDAPIEEAPVEDLLIDELPAEETPVEEAPVEEAPVEEAPVEEAPVEEAPVEDLLIDELPTEEAPVEDAPIEEAPAEEAPAEDLLIDELPLEDAPANEGTEGDTPDVSADSDISDLLSSLNSDINSVPSEDDSVEDILAKLDFGDTDVSDIPNMENTDSINPETGENMLDLSESDLAGLIDAASDVKSDNPEGEIEIDLSDLSSLESDFGIVEKGTSSDGETSAELDEISSLLNTIDSNEPVSDEDSDMLSMLEKAVSEQEQEEDMVTKEKRLRALESQEEDKPDKPSKAEKGGKKLFKKKKSKELPEGEIEVGEKKPGFFKKLLDFLTAAEEEEEEGESLIQATDVNPEGFEGVPGENQEILKEMDAEGDGKKGKKKKKKDKKKKGGEEASSEGEGEGEEGEEGDGKKKKKKEKPKKEKKERKPLELDIEGKKPLNKKNVRKIFVMAFSILAAIIILINLVPPAVSKSNARKAYYKGDYETVYNTFFGNDKLNETDKLLFDRSELILRMEHKYSAYISYSKMNMEIEALDQLMQAVYYYDAWIVIASSLGNTTNFNKSFEKVTNALQVKYGLSLEQAKEIIAMSDDLAYSLKLYSIVTGTEYIDPSLPLPGPFVAPVNDLEPDKIYEDVLPEEE